MRISFAGGMLTALCTGLTFFTVSATPWQPVQAQPAIQITLRDGSISPAQFTASKGELVQLRITNRGTRTHNFVIPAFFIFTQNLNPGEGVSASFRPDKTGSFPYYSDTGGQPEPGMRGTLTVQ